MSYPYCESNPHTHKVFTESLEQNLKIKNSFFRYASELESHQSLSVVRESLNRSFEAIHLRFVSILHLIK